MPASKKIFIVFLFLEGLLLVYFLWGIQNIPFHPDESTYLFMSSDFDALVHNPLSLAWVPNNEKDEKQYHRELDAPLIRYILGAGRSIARLPALQSNWSWIKTWRENQKAGAVPDQELLTAGRIAVTLLLPISLLFLYLIGNSAGNRFTGLLAAILLGTNALALLHDRRAMAEGALTLGVTFALWSFLQGDRRPWLAGLAIALAVNSKQSTAALLPVGLLAVCWSAPEKPFHWKRIVTAAAEYLGIFLILTVLLNPFLWKDPVQATKSAITARAALQYNQSVDWVSIAHSQLLETPVQRFAGLIANLYLTPPAFAEVNNYTPWTKAAENGYRAMPGHNLMRGLLGGGILFGLALAGFVLAAIGLRGASSEKRRVVIVLLLATCAQALAILLLTPLPWQRYVMPLVPLSCLWAAYTFSLLLEWLVEASGKRLRIRQARGS